MEVLIAEGRGPHPSDPGAPWKDAKRQRSGKLHRRTSSQRSHVLGLEVKPELVWEDWDLGPEYAKTLVLRNIHSKLQKLHVRPPVSNCFTASIPQTIVLSPGISYSIPVTFRPLERCEYEDSIEFQGADGSFRVCLRANVPCHSLEVPVSVLMPLCAVRHSSLATFPLRNVSNLQTSFQWECKAPFQLSPEQGLLKPGQECHITALFRPLEALVYQQQADCRFGGEEGQGESCCSVLLQGLAKYPYLQLSNPGTTDEKQQSSPVLQFGSVSVGQSSQKCFDISNPSPVTASFSLSHPCSDVSEFRCDVNKGKVAPGGSVRVNVTYTPAAVDSVSVEYVTVKCRGTLRETLLKLTGSCVGPKVSLSSSVVDFGCVEEGGTVSQTVQLVNTSSTEALYQWDLDCNGHSVFRIQPASGTVRPHSHTTLQAFYKPTQPIAHHRRVACVILHRDPMFLDLIGTCHSALEQPAVLKPDHLLLHEQDPADSLSAVQQDCNEQLDQEGVVCADGEQSHQKAGGAGVLSRTPMEEYYHSCLGSPYVSVVPSELLFNHKTTSSLSTTSTSQAVSIANHTRGKLSLVWTTCRDSPFSVSPSASDLAPLKSTSFRVTYDPSQLNTLHGAQLECFAFYKDNVDAEEQPLCPSWCVTVRVIAHSFQPFKEHFIPSCSLKSPRVVFPPLGVLSYQTRLLQNHGDLPLTFCLDHSSSPAWEESLSVVPICGLIPPGDHQILTLRTTPTADSPPQGLNVRLLLNASQHTEELTVVSVVEKLTVSLEGNGSLYFHPTAVGSRTQRSHFIRNLSRLPLRFQWSIPESDQELISVEPPAGELHPNDSAVQIWSFSPLAEETYTLEATLAFWLARTPGCNQSELPLQVEGMGCKGFIEAEKELLDVGDVLVGSSRWIEVPLVNNSLCPVSFCLSVRQILLDEDPVSPPETVPSALKLDCETGIITPNSTMLIRSTIRPDRPAQYMWTISYQTLNATGFVSSASQELCQVRAKGTFPTLKVVDVCGRGSVGTLSKEHLWKLFSLDSLMEHLLCNPTSTELIYGTPTRHSLSSSPSIFTKAVIDFNFGAAPLNSERSTFVLRFHNPGSIPVDWAFLFPEDQQIELEYWAETGEFSSRDLYQMKIQDTHVFSISPRSGTLLSGQQRTVQFSYSHDCTGADRLPVVFKLSYGREILLNFVGMTVERDTSYLHFASKRHVFTSVDVGDFTPPKQVYELHNGGATQVSYEVDLAVLSQLQVDNFNHPVLCCLNPEGEIPPGKTAMLEWIFSPLEVKMYHMDIPIHVQGGDSTLVRFEGWGFKPPALGSQNRSKVSEPSVQRRPFPGQMVFLSEDCISLGDIPVCSRSSRIFFLTNVSHTETVLYAWDKSSQEVVQIHPEQGSLSPGQSVLCVLTFTSTDYPTCYQLNVICEVIHEAALTRYHDALQRWEQEKERQQYEFTITDKHLAESQLVLSDKAAPVTKGPPLRKYKTLPPIPATNRSETLGAACTKVTRAERRAQREMAKVWQRPEPPQPALVHLGVSARSYGLLEYQARFPDHFNKHYRCLQSVTSQQPESTTSPSTLPERDITTHVLTSLLRGIFDDEAFTQDLITSASRPTTYWLQEPTPCTGAPAGHSKQHSPVDSEGTAGCSGAGLHAEHAPADLCEDILLNTLQNLMMEAFSGELVLTAHPHTVILPPVSTRGTSKVVAEDKDEQEPAGT